jgi:hypothetical protein
MIEGGRLSLKTERSVRRRVSTGIILQNKIDRQMSSAVKTTERNPNEASREAGSRFPNSCVRRSSYERGKPAMVAASSESSLTPA